jgi:hypothetical protein
MWEERMGRQGQDEDVVVWEWDTMNLWAGGGRERCGGRVHCVTHSVTFFGMCTPYFGKITNQAKVMYEINKKNK